MPSTRISPITKNSIKTSLADHKGLPIEGQNRALKSSSPKNTVKPIRISTNLIKNHHEIIRNTKNHTIETNNNINGFIIQPKTESGYSPETKEQDYRQSPVKESRPVLTPYQRLLKHLNEDERCQREMNLGRRIGFYRFQNDIGSGNFSQVKMATHCLTKDKVAIKMLDKCKMDNKTQHMFTREIASMAQLHHPNIIRIFEVIETFSKYYIVMELAPNGELFQKISKDGRFSENDAKVYFTQIVSAIEHMHIHNIVHRDIKAENVFFADRSTVKLGDLGFSIQVASMDTLLNTFCGSPPYAAPELFVDESYIGELVDIWALGILLYFMVTATMPFKATTVSTLKKLILEGQYQLPTYLSPLCQQLIKELLKHEPKERLSIKKLKAHRWIENCHFTEAAPILDRCRSPDKKSNHSSCQQSEFIDEEEENEAQKILDTLGINSIMIDDSYDKGIRCNIVGTYRIVMYRIIANKLRRKYSPTKSWRTEFYSDDNMIDYQKRNTAIGDSNNNTKIVKSQKSVHSVFSTGSNPSTKGAFIIGVDDSGRRKKAKKRKLCIIQ